MCSRHFDQRVTVAQIDAADDAAIESALAGDCADERRCRCAIIVADVEPQNLEFRCRSFDHPRSQRRRRRLRGVWCQCLDRHHWRFNRRRGGQRALHFFRLRRRDANAKRFGRFALTLEQTQRCGRDLQRIVILEQRLERREFTRTHTVCEDLAQLAHARSVTSHGLRHGVRQHEVRQRAAGQQRPQMRHLARRHQRDDLHRMSTERRIERGACRRHVVQHAQHAVRFDCTASRLHIAIQRVVPQRAQRGVCLGHLLSFRRDDDR